MHPSIFTQDAWQIMMFWYAVLTTIGGGFLLLSVVKSGYSYMYSALNPGVRASFIEDIQRAFMAMLLVIMAPVLVILLSDINDGFVWLFGKLLTAFVSAPPNAGGNPVSIAVSLFENIIAAPFKTLIYIFNTLFGLKNLDQLIFNGSTNVFASTLTNSINTGNMIADVLMQGSLVAFDVYFNALYTIRKWVITATLVSTPIIVWVWAITANRQVLEIWVAEIIQTIFMQASHAMALGIFMSISAGTSAVIGKVVDATWLSSGLLQIGVFFAGFGGSICVAVIIFLGIRLITTRNQEDRSKAMEGLTKAFIALAILGLCVAIASFLAVLFSGDWGV